MIGRTISRYRILSKLGEGGMGSVWKAEDPLLGRTIALKFLPESLANSPEFRRRFLREAQAASVLSHPGIATVFDAGEADGVVYIAMLFVDGETIMEQVTHGPLPQHEAVRIAISAAEALGHAHSHGVLHRDVTSRNIMVGRDGRVVVVDFGLALPEGHTQLTRTGAAMGTAAYMSPEVVQGQKADRRSDLYGLGVVLYEMLTGTLPFRAERGEAMLYAAVHKIPDPPSQRLPGLPPEPDGVVLKLLAKNPEKRYQTAQELVRELRGLVRRLHLPGMELPPEAADDAIGAKPPASERPEMGETALPLSSAPTASMPGAAESYEEVRVRPSRGKTSRVSRRARVLVVLTALGLAVLGAVLWKSGLFEFATAPSAPHFSSVAILPLNNTSENPAESDYLAEGIGRALAIKFTQALGLQVTPYDTSQRFSDLSKSMQEIARELKVEALVVGTFTKVGDQIQCSVTLVDGKTGMQFWAEEIQEPSGQLFAVQRRIATGVAAKLKGTLTGREEQNLAQPAARSVEAYDFYLRGASAMQAGDLGAANTALAYFKKAVELDPDLAEAYVGIGAVSSEKFYNGWEGGAGALEEAKVNFQHALDLNPNLPSALAGLVKVYWYKGDGEECLKLGKRAASLGREDVDTLLARSQAYIFGGIADKAVPLLQRVLELDPANPAAHWFLVLANVWSGQNREAIAAGDAYFRKFGEDPEIERMMGWSFHAMGNVDQAQLRYEKAIELFGYDDSSDTLMSLGNLYEQSGKPEKAREAWLKAVEVLKGRLKAYPDYYPNRLELVHLYALLGDRAMVQKEESLLPSELPPTNLALLINAYATLGDSPRATELLRLAIKQTNYQELALLQYQAKPYGAESVWSTRESLGVLKEFEAIKTRLRAEY